MCKTKLKKVILLSFIFLTVAIFTACKPPLFPKVTGIITGIVADISANYSDYAYYNKEENIGIIKPYLPVSDALVTIIDNQGISHYTQTNSEGYYQFENLFISANTFIDMVKETNQGKKVYRDIIPIDISPEESYYVGITSAFATARVLVVEALLSAGKKINQIDLEKISQNKYFAKLVELVSKAQMSEKDLANHYLVQKQINLIIRSIICPSNSSSPVLISPPLPHPPPLSSAKDFLSYQFRAEDNAALSSDIIGRIDEEMYLIELIVPYNTDLTNLIATFELSAYASAYIVEDIQESGTTSNDFNHTLTYTIIAEDGSKRDWQVVVDKEIGPLHHFAIAGYPDSCIAGDDFGVHDITITACDINNKVKYDYQGEVYFTTTDSKAKLPYIFSQKYTFTEDDQGRQVFPADGFMFETAGSQIIAITDGEISAETEPITVLAAPLVRFQLERIDSQIVGVPFNITITAKDRFWNTVTDYHGINTLSDTTNTIIPKNSGNFVNGIWSGEVTISFTQNNVQITTSGDGKTGYSNLFNILP